MRVFPLVAARYGGLHVVDWLEGRPTNGARRKTIDQPSPPRTVYNALTRQYEEIPLTQFQQMLNAGTIQETVDWTQCDGRGKRVFRLI